MRDIRTRIAQRQGVDLSTQQIQDLAARRLESILDPRAVKPSLLDALRHAARDTPPRHAPDAFDELTFTFEDSTIYDSHRGVLRFMRRLLNPILKLLFNPNPVIGALHRQARINTLRAERDADRDREQTEWNALHYEIVQRLVTEVSRVSLELKSITTRIESLDAKLEFNERRVRGIEGATHRSRPQPRSIASAPAGATVARETHPVQTTPVQATPVQTTADEATGAVEGAPAEPAKRRRRRRRGRRQDSPQGVVARAGDATPVGTPATEAHTTGASEETSDSPPHPPIVAIVAEPSAVADGAPDPT
ncbi:MAG: hypothetical protein O2930_16075, partial [Acidobacteria bacterium]|nr:hypothetical protein [Acidobacteriota bacterium]